MDKPLTFRTIRIVKQSDVLTGYGSLPGETKHLITTTFDANSVRSHTFLPLTHGQRLRQKDTWFYTAFIGGIVALCLMGAICWLEDVRLSSFQQATPLPVQALLYCVSIFLGYWWSWKPLRRILMTEQAYRENYLGDRQKENLHIVKEKDWEVFRRKLKPT